MNRERDSWEKRLEMVIKHRKRVLNDLLWMRWRPPAESVKYATLYLFNLDNTCRIKKSNLLEVHSGIFCNKIILTSRTPEVMLNALKKPPFGKVVVRRIDKREDETIIYVDWYWSKDLPANESIQPLEDHVLLTLESIILFEGGWLAKINNQWLHDECAKKIKNVEILKVSKYSLTAAVRTPAGPRNIELNCGDDIRVNYLPC